MLVEPDRMEMRHKTKMLVACCTRKERKIDDAVVSCRLIVDSSFRAFLTKGWWP